MTGLATNIFPIVNLSTLSSRYRLYRIKGLRPEQSEYYQNVGIIKRKLSYLLKNPVTVVQRDGMPYLVVREEQGVNVPSNFPLVRVVARFEPCPESFVLDYTLRTPENDEICLRFLQFLIQEPLHRNPQLWQTSSGRPFFLRRALWSNGKVEQFQGFSVRAVITPDGGLGLAVDVANRFVSKYPLPVLMNHDEFNCWKGKPCIYRYGHQWFEMKAEYLADDNVSEHLIPDNGNAIPLLDFIMREATKPLPPELAQLPHDCSVVIYQNNQGEERAAPSPLCFPLLDTHTEAAAGLQGRTIMAPYHRYPRIYELVRGYLGRLRFGNTQLKFADAALVAPRRMFTVPDLEFGGKQILSVRGTEGAHQVSLDNLGAERLALMKSPSAGFYVQDAMDRQYFLIPQSVLDSFGEQFLGDIKQTISSLFPHGAPYSPIIVPYDDHRAKTYAQQGKAIMEAAQAECIKPGFAVAMIHHTSDRKSRHEDQLAAMVTRELRELDVIAAVIHTEVGRECYTLVQDADGNPRYRVQQHKRGKLAGYLRGVAINSILLTNQRWPFALATPLHADLVVGIDVKHSTAGLIVVSRHGGTIRPMCKSSRQKEQLLPEQIKSYFSEIVRDEVLASLEQVKHITIHRDGRLFPGERLGLLEAFQTLKNKSLLPDDATLTLVEIPKTSPVPLRLFDVSERHGRTWIDNPQVGSYYLANDTDGYVCTTGRAFKRPGTVRPLHVRRLEGAMSLEHCLEDVYFLSVLAWVRPEDCMRDPITTKLNDRFLGDEATEYDPDVLEFDAVNEEDTDE